jgi:hypothetical protein
VISGAFTMTEAIRLSDHERDAQIIPIHMSHGRLPALVSAALLILAVAVS